MAGGGGGIEQLESGVAEEGRVEEEEDSAAGGGAGACPGLFTKALAVVAAAMLQGRADAERDAVGKGAANAVVSVATRAARKLRSRSTSEEARRSGAVLRSSTTKSSTEHRMPAYTSVRLRVSSKK